MYPSDQALEKARAHLGRPDLSPDEAIDMLVDANNAALGQAEAAGAVSLSRAGPGYQGDETPGPLGRARFDALMADAGYRTTDADYAAHVAWVRPASEVDRIKQQYGLR